jgi:hypothetical protein
VRGDGRAIRHPGTRSHTLSLRRCPDGIQQSTAFLAFQRAILNILRAKWTPFPRHSRLLKGLSVPMTPDDIDERLRDGHRRRDLHSPVRSEHHRVRGRSQPLPQLLAPSTLERSAHPHAPSRWRDHAVVSEGAARGQVGIILASRCGWRRVDAAWYERPLVPDQAMKPKQPRPRELTDTPEKGEDIP